MAASHGEDRWGGLKHARNGLEYGLPELPHFSVGGYFLETKTIYDYFGCHFHGHPCQTFRAVVTRYCDSLAARYEQTMARL